MNETVIGYSTNQGIAESLGKASGEGNRWRIDSYEMDTQIDERKAKHWYPVSTIIDGRTIEARKFA